MQGLGRMLGIMQGAQGLGGLGGGGGVNRGVAKQLTTGVADHLRNGVMA